MIYPQPQIDDDGFLLSSIPRNHAFKIIGGKRGEKAKFLVRPGKIDDLETFTGATDDDNPVEAEYLLEDQDLIDDEMEDGFVATLMASTTKAYWFWIECTVSTTGIYGATTTAAEMKHGFEPSANGWTTFPNQGDWETTGKGFLLIGYVLKVRTEPEQDEKWKLAKIQNLFFDVKTIAPFRQQDSIAPHHDYDTLIHLPGYWKNYSPYNTSPDWLKPEWFDDLYVEPIFNLVVYGSATSTERHRKLFWAHSPIQFNPDDFLFSE